MGEPYKKMHIDVFTLVQARTTSLENRGSPERPRDLAARLKGRCPETPVPYCKSDLHFYT